MTGAGVPALARITRTIELIVHYNFLYYLIIFYIGFHMCSDIFCTGNIAFRGYIVQQCVAILLYFAPEYLQIAVEWLR